MKGPGWTQAHLGLRLCPVLSFSEQSLYRRPGNRQGGCLAQEPMLSRKARGCSRPVPESQNLPNTLYRGSSKKAPLTSFSTGTSALVQQSLSPWLGSDFFLVF